MLVSLSLAVGANLLFSVNDLLGPGVLFAFAAGRYSEPRIEERALLFIDMRSSTAIAERLGEIRYLKFLNRFIADVSLGVAEGGGEIHKYVGDEIIATWRLAPGVNEAPCVGACFAALERLNAQAPAYEREFGQRADFRAGLHCGPVAVGELGTLKKEIALIGDAMNTAARILEACRAADNRVLASAALLDRVAALPPGVTRRGLGELAMRGKERALELYVLSPSWRELADVRRRTAGRAARRRALPGVKMRELVPARDSRALSRLPAGKRVAPALPPARRWAACPASSPARRRCDTMASAASPGHWGLRS